MKKGRTIAVSLGAFLVVLGFVHYFLFGFDCHSPVEGCAMVGLGVVLLWGMIMVLRDINRPED